MQSAIQMQGSFDVERATNVCHALYVMISAALNEISLTKNHGAHYRRSVYFSNSSTTSTS